MSVLSLLAAANSFDGGDESAEAIYVHQQSLHSVALILEFSVHTCSTLCGQSVAWTSRCVCVGVLSVVPSKEPPQALL